MSLCEQFVTRAQRRLTAHDEERTRLASELEEGQSRLARLREAATTAKEVPVPPCVIQPECGGHTAHLEEGRTQGDTYGKLRRFASPRQFGRLVHDDRGEDEGVDKRSVPTRWREGRQLVISPRNHWEQDQHGPARCDQRRQQTEGAVPVRYVRRRVHVAQCTG